MVSLSTVDPGRQTTPVLKLRYAVPALIFVFAIGLGEPGLATPCCVALVCEDLAPSVCATSGGIEGHCRVGEPCGAASCDLSAVLPLKDVTAIKSTPTDVLFSWTSDANADSYAAWYVTLKTDLPVADGRAPSQPVPGSTPTNIAEAPHRSAIPATPTLFHYNFVPLCSLTPPTGACCESTGSCLEDVTPADCAAMSGFYGGDGSTCAFTPCIPIAGACCKPGGFCEEVVTETDCVFLDGVWAGPLSDCAATDCRLLLGACCDIDDICQGDQSALSCAALTGTYVGDATSCAGIDCTVGACCFTGGVCEDGLNSFVCETREGAFGGAGSVCSGVSCPALLGTCCDPFGTCSDLSSRVECEAAGSTYGGDGTDCVTDPC